MSSDEIPVVHEDDELVSRLDDAGDRPNGAVTMQLVVSKPCSIPTHPCGAYRHNSLHSILLHLFPELKSLHVVHRLDRLTSGTFSQC